jgi:RNA polymerase sigma-70 factor (ECF subfamily)
MAAEAPADDALQPGRYRNLLWVLATAAVSRRWHRRFDASDIVQDALLAAHAAREQFRGTCPAELVAWLKTILKNELLRQIRHHTEACRDIGLEVWIDEELEKSSVGIRQVLVDAAPTPPSAVLAWERLAQLADWIYELPASQREALILNHFTELPYAEIARSMGRTKNSVASLLRRATEKIRERGAAYGESSTA